MIAIDYTRDGIAAARAGELEWARQLFAQALADDPQYAMAWLWLGSVCADARERRYCFRRALGDEATQYHALRRLEQAGDGPEMRPAILLPDQQAAAAKQPQPRARRWRWPRALLRVLVLLAVVAVLFAVFGDMSRISAAVCSDRAQQYLAATQPLTDEWSQSFRAATAAGRAALPAQLARLQSVRQRFADIAPPACLSGAHAEMLASMGSSIDGFRAFLAKEDNQRVNALFGEAAGHMQAYTSLLAAAHVSE